ncbi:hypothetical protein NDU88_003242 [Pleurodeles waltl]|uniref:Uncharacterized protein n=1 Tax=Pleurodeles waltl TaxID=8319 RepID=A0AAV7T4F1_PLEWA|nr:hypothetical protein NDU88_003242 [Pleurodeles waltl]
MCLPAFGGTGIQSASLEEEGEAPGGRLRHWKRAALELRRVRRGAARIPLWGNPGRISTSKVHLVAWQCTKTGSLEGGCSGSRAHRRLNRAEWRGLEPPPLFSKSFQVGGPGQREGERGSEDCGAQGKRSAKALEPGRNPLRRGGEGRQKVKNKLTPSLRAYFRVRPEGIVLIPGQEIMDKHTVQALVRGWKTIPSLKLRTGPVKRWYKSDLSLPPRLVEVVMR